MLLSSGTLLSCSAECNGLSSLGNSSEGLRGEPDVGDANAGETAQGPARSGAPGPGRDLRAHHPADAVCRPATWSPAACVPLRQTQPPLCTRGRDSSVGTRCTRHLGPVDFAPSLQRRKSCLVLASPPRWDTRERPPQHLHVVWREVLQESSHRYGASLLFAAAAFSQP